MKVKINSSGKRAISFNAHLNVFFLVPGTQNDDGVGRFFKVSVVV